MAAKKRAKKKLATKARTKAPIEYWSHSSLMAFLRNPLAWYKRYVHKIYDAPRTPSAVVGTAAHLALQRFYEGESKEESIMEGLESLRLIPNYEIEFGKAKTRRAQADKRARMEREYLQAINFYLTRPPRHKVVGVEVKGTVHVDDLPIPIKAISDLVVESKGNPGCLDIVDHKFVDMFWSKTTDRPAFILQAIFNYYTVSELFKKPVKRFIVYECKKRKAADGGTQMRKHVLNYDDMGEMFAVFNRLVHEATAEIMRPRHYLPNPSDMFEGAHSFEVYRLGLLE